MHTAYSRCLFQLEITKFNVVKLLSKKNVCSSEVLETVNILLRSRISEGFLFEE